VRVALDQMLVPSRVGECEVIVKGVMLYLEEVVHKGGTSNTSKDVYSSFFLGLLFEATCLA